MGSSPTPGTMQGLQHGGSTRLAPTPSGFLHAGNALNFLITSQLARAHGATLRLRIDDLDTERVRPAYVQDIFGTLDWLGIRPDVGPVSAQDHALNWSQAARAGRYLAFVERLRADGHLYACTCSRKQQVLDAAGRYAGTCRSRGLPFDAPDTAWRLRIPEGVHVTVPSIAGLPVVVDLAAAMGDPVLRQRNGRPAYQIASLADDLDHGTTFIVRGADLLPSTACQLYIAGLLGPNAFAQVRFLHHDLLLDAQGEKMSKSGGAASLKAMREAGAGPQDLVRQAGTLLSGLLNP